MARGRPKKKTAADITLGIRKSIVHGETGADTEQLLADLISEWGGTKNLARDIKSSFDSCPEGSMTRQRFLEMVQRLIITSTSQGLAASADPSEMTDAELNEVAIHYAEKVAAHNDEGDDNAVAEGGAKEGFAFSTGEGSIDVEAGLEPLDKVTDNDEWDF